MIAAGSMQMNLQKTTYLVSKWRRNAEFACWYAIFQLHAQFA